MNTIDLHEATIVHSIVQVAYTLNDTDVPFEQIKFDTLVEFVKENELNMAYLEAPDELAELDAETFTRDNLNYVVKEYLEDQK